MCETLIKKGNKKYLILVISIVTLLGTGFIYNITWSENYEPFFRGISTTQINDPYIYETSLMDLPSSLTRAHAKVDGISQWDVEVLAQFNKKTSGCTIGDLDLSREGNEIVTVNGDGLVAMIYQTKTGSWESLTLWQGQGELITPVIGDFYPNHDGKELLVVGMAIGMEDEIGAGQATMIYGKGNSWKHSVIYIAPNMLHGAAVGDLDPERNGSEVVVMSFGFDVEMLTPNGTGPADWTVTHMWHAEGKVRKGIIDDIDPTRDGNELVVVDKSGNCSMLYGSGDNWTVETLFTDDNPPGLARVVVGDVDSAYSGKEIIVGGDSNRVSLIWRSGDTWDGEVIFTDSDKIRGLGVGDVDPSNKGNELLVFGYSKNVTMLTKSVGSWKPRVLYIDDRAHDLAVGEVDPDHDGLEIVFVGYSKNVTMLSVSPWYYKVLSEFNEKTSGCTIGDLDLSRDGNEIVTVNGDGLVAMIYQTKTGSWESLTLWQGQGELITPVIGDFYPNHDGKELLVVGMAIGMEDEIGAGQATMIYGKGDNWNHAVMYIAPNMLHGAAVGDLDPNHNGSEVVVMSFGFDVEMLTPNGTGPDDWTVTHMWHAEGKVRKGVIDDIDPTRDGNELVVVDKSGNCSMLYGSGNNWTVETLFFDDDPPGLARVAVGEVDPSYSGKEIIVGGDSNHVSLIWRSGNTWDGEVIFTDSDKIRGLGVGDVDPKNPGNEILVFGYSQNVTMLTKSGNTWKPDVIYMDTGRAHDLAVGEFYDDHEGQELVVVGYSNNVTMVFNIGSTESAGFSLYAYPLDQTIFAGKTAEFTIGALAKSGFNELVKFSTSDLPSDLSAIFTPSSIIPDSTSKLTITTPITNKSSDINFKVNAESGILSHSIDLHLRITGDAIAPEIDRTYPADDAEDIPPETSILVWFTEPIDPNSVSPDSVTIIEDGTEQEYEGTVRYDQNTDVIIISDIKEDLGPEAKSPAGLPNAKLIKVTIDTSIKDISGNQLAKKYQFDFITRRKLKPSGESPEIDYVFPIKDTKGNPLETPVVVRFSVPMDESTLNWNNIEIICTGGGKYTGTINYDQESLTMTITGIQTVDGSRLGFLNDSEVTVTLKSAIKTIADKALASDYTWSFETGLDKEKDDDKEKVDEGVNTAFATILVIIIMIIIVIMFFSSVLAKRRMKEESEEPKQQKKSNKSKKK